MVPGTFGISVVNITAGLVCFFHSTTTGWLLSLFFNIFQVQPSDPSAPLYLVLSKSTTFSSDIGSTSTSTLHVPPLPCVLPLATLYSVTLYNSPPHILESSDILPSCCLQYFRVTWLNNCAFGYMILFWGIFCTLFFVFLRASLVVLTTTT